MEKLLEDVFIRCSIISFVGWLLNLLKNLNNVRRDSLMHNIVFSYKNYFDLEKFALAINAISQLMVMLYIHDILEFTGKTWVATVFIGICAFFGSEFVTYIFGSAKKLYVREIDRKTTVADQVENNQLPTPLK